MMNVDKTPILRRIKEWRDQLIDISRRNPLLSLPKTSIRIDAAASDIWKLPTAGKRGAFVFLSRSDSLFENGPPPNTHTQFVDDKEGRRINALRQKAELSLSEHGTNILFVAVGVMEWKDPRPNITEPLRSPILLLPVRLSRLPDQNGYALTRLEDDATINPTLRHRMAMPDIGIALPEADEEDITPQTYLPEFERTIGGRFAAKIIRDECVLGRFSYLNLEMQKDLETQEERAAHHPIIAALAGDKTALEALPPIEVPSEESLDAQTLPDFHVLPADPSQEQAILAARLGQSFVLEGPPGTGKTQTIANIIAACIADGKRVLFVSEKMAALEAVYRRLKDRKLDTFCLEAHSHKANKTEILSQLRAALAVRDEKAPSPATSERDRLRDDLNAHCAALHESRLPLNVSPYEARARVAALGSVPDTAFTIPDPASADSDLLFRGERLAEQLDPLHRFFSVAETHFWRGLRAESFLPTLREELRGVLDDLLHLADAAPGGVNALRVRCGLDLMEGEVCRPADADTALTVANHLLSLLDLPSPARPYLQNAPQSLRNLHGKAGELDQRQNQLNETEKRLLFNWTPAIFALPHDELLHRLTDAPRAQMETAFGLGWADKSDLTLEEDSQTLSELEQAAAMLGQGGRRIAELTGLDAVTELRSALRVQAILAEATKDPKPQPAWFAPDALPELNARAGEAQEIQRDFARCRTFLDSCYQWSPGVKELDLEPLRERFQNDYKNVLRVFHGQYWSDLKTVRQTLRADASLKGRNIVTDLEWAINAKNKSRWLNENAAALSAAFGEYYRDANTDWPTLTAALQQTKRLIEEAGDVSPKLQCIVVASRSQMAELKEWSDHFSGQIAEMERALAACTGRFVLMDGRTPPNALSLSALILWAQELRATMTDFRAAHRASDDCRREAGARTTWLIEGLREALAFRQTLTAWEAESPEVVAQFGHPVDLRRTHWQKIAVTLEAVFHLRELCGVGEGTIPPGTIAFASSASPAEREEMERLRASVRNTMERGAALWESAETLFWPEALRRDRSRLSERPYAEMSDFCGEGLGALSDLEDWFAFDSLKRQMAKLGMPGFIPAVVRAGVAPERLAEAFRKAFHQQWLERVLASDDHLRDKRGETLDRWRRRFAVLDRAELGINPNRVRAQTLSRRGRLPQSDAGEIGILRRWLNQRRPRTSVRKMLNEIPNLLFRLTPCLLMSPLSVSLFLNAERIEFDVVIFDEASQILVEYALGPLMRAKQAIIAGDTRQLPPTSFFKSVQDDGGDGDAEEEGNADAAVTVGSANEFESVLSAAAAFAESDAQGARRFPVRYLAWHYRSRHESLITFSRRHFYEKLQTFPSAARLSALGFVFVPDGVYYGGQGAPRNNPVEAALVAALVAAQIRTNPKQSVGVITMSGAQQEAIYESIDKLRASDPELASLLSEEASEDKLEPFFIKNIENVQGDQRDVIFLSVGYGKYPDGRMFQRFGPLSTKGGERRLNVAITRAKCRCITVASILPQDVSVSETTGEGVRMLARYIEEARAAQTATDSVNLDADANSAPTEDFFADAIARALKAKGFETRRDVGAFEYRVSVAVVDPADPSRFLLGIECDGDVYRRGVTARGREYMRDDVLRGLGWQTLRVWSADWLRDPGATLGGILEAIAKAQRGESLTPSDPESDPLDIALPEKNLEPALALAGEAATSQSKTGTEARDEGLPPGITYFRWVRLRPFRNGSQDLYGDTSEAKTQRERVVREVIEVMGPFPAEDVGRYLAEAAGLQRTGAKIARIADATIRGMATSGRLSAFSDSGVTFLASVGRTETPARIPFPGESPRSIEMVSRREIGAILAALVRFHVGMSVSEAVTETGRLLRYDRISENINNRIQEALAELEISGRIVSRDGQLHVL